MLQSAVMYYNVLIYGTLVSFSFKFKNQFKHCICGLYNYYIIEQLNSYIITTCINLEHLELFRPWELEGGGPSLRASSLTLEAPGLHDTNLYGGM